MGVPHICASIPQPQQSPEQSRRASDRIKFHIRLRLPRSTPNVPMKLEGISTSLPSFAHSIGDLGNSVFFDWVVLRSDHAPIKALVRGL